MSQAINTYLNLDHIPQGSTIIVGLSGGPDSVFLLHLLAQARTKKELTVVAAHLDHQWRSNSDIDAQFCTTLCSKLNIELELSQASNFKSLVSKNGSAEDEGRQMRRLFFNQLADKHNASCIALGHHAQDQEETFFIRLIRGSSLAGLTGMKEIDGKYWRPLLSLSKEKITKFLNDNTIPYLVDPTNKDTSYLRNSIRLNVLPAMRAADTRADKNILATMTQLQECENYITAMLDEHYQSVVDNTALNITTLLDLHPFMQQQVILRWLIEHQTQFTPSQALFAEIIRFLKQPHGGSHTIKNWTITKQKNKATITK